MNIFIAATEREMNAGVPPSEEEMARIVAAVRSVFPRAQLLREGVHVALQNPPPVSPAARYKQVGEERHLDGVGQIAK